MASPVKSDLVIAHDLLLVQFYLYRYRKEDRRITVIFFRCLAFLCICLGHLFSNKERIRKDLT